MFNRRVAEKHCHDPACQQFNIMQEFRYTAHSWKAPGEWIDEPYCGSCHADIGDDQHDHEYDPLEAVE